MVEAIAEVFVPAMVIGLWLALSATCLWVLLRPGPIDVAMAKVLSGPSDAGALPENGEPVVAGPEHPHPLAPTEH
jgi:hypothetical protein